MSTIEVFVASRRPLPSYMVTNTPGRWAVVICRRLSLNWSGSKLDTKLGPNVKRVAAVLLSEDSRKPNRVRPRVNIARIVLVKSIWADEIVPLTDCVQTKPLV